MSSNGARGACFITKPPALPVVKDTTLSGRATTDLKYEMQDAKFQVPVSTPGMQEMDIV